MEAIPQYGTYKAYNFSRGQTSHDMILVDPFSNRTIIVGPLNWLWPPKGLSFLWKHLDRDSARLPHEILIARALSPILTVSDAMEFALTASAALDSTEAIGERSLCRVHDPSPA